MTQVIDYLKRSNCLTLALSKIEYETKTIVLRKNLNEFDARDMVEQKKTSIFRSMLRKPSKDDVHVHSLTLLYEAVLMISGKYVADFFRKATHTITVDHNVKEVVLGEGVFPIKTKSGFEKALSRKKSKNKIDLRVEEHVFVKEENTMYFDHHGKEIKFPFKINSKTIENYPKKVLSEHSKNVKKPEIKHDTIIEKLSHKLKKPLEPDVRNLNDELTIKEISEIYVPIFEARLVGPKKKIEILRIDAVRKKVL